MAKIQGFHISNRNLNEKENDKISNKKRYGVPRFDPIGFLWWICVCNQIGTIHSGNFSYYDFPTWFIKDFRFQQQQSILAIVLQPCPL